jgi:hypothetical protein
MCNFGLHGLATQISLETASAKTHGLTNKMHLGNERRKKKKPNVLIYIHNHI